MKRTRTLAFLILFFVVLGGMMVFAFNGTQSVAPAAPSSGDFSLMLTTNPNIPGVGDVTLVVDVRDRNGRPVNDAAVSISASHTSMAGMNLAGQATAQGGGRYAVAGKLGMSGAWRAKIEVNRPGAQPVTQEFDIAVK